MIGKFYTYVYIDPRTSTPFYVGKGIGNRAERHLTKQRGSGTNKQLFGYIRNMRDDGYEPLVLIEEKDTEELAFALEIELIKKYGRKDEGTGPLFNHTDGGEGGSGYRFSEERKQRHSMVMRSLPQDIRDRMSGKGGHKRKHTAEHNAKISRSKRLKSLDP